MNQGHLRLLASEKQGEEIESRPVLESLIAYQAREGRELVTQLRTNQQLGTYVSGLPGVGKSTFLLHLILDDIRAGRSCCVLDPHGDLIAAILKRCPAEDEVLRRIVLFSPADTDWPVGLNLLDATTERGRDLAVQFMLELYEELFLPEHQGPMLHQALRNGMRLLMDTGGILPELPLLFTDVEFLKKRLAECRDTWVRHYFERVWLPWRGDSKSESMAYFTSKLSCFLDDALVRNIVGQRTGLDLASLCERGGVLLADLSRGAIGEQNARLLGMILLHRLERVAVERAGVAPEERRPVHVYVDEFHEFATKGLARFLAAARKFNVGLTLAHQRLETLRDPLLREAILGAVGHVVLFRQRGSEWFSALPRLVWPRFGERELLGLPNYEAVARVTGANGTAQLGRLRVPRAGGGQDETADRVRVETWTRWSRPRSMVEREILERLGWAAPAEKGDLTWISEK